MLETYLHKETLVAPQFFRESIPAHTTYRIKGIRSADPALALPRRLPIATETIPYLFFLHVNSPTKTKPVAMLGFDTTNETTLCREIHGCKGEFHALKPVSWDLALLTHFVDTSRKAGYKEAHVLHSSAITMPITTGSEENAGRRLEKRYDHNAEHLGFTYNPKIKRYVLTL